MWDCFTGFEKQFLTQLFFFKKYVNMDFSGEIYKRDVAAIDEKYKEQSLVTDFTGEKKHYKVLNFNMFIRYYYTFLFELNYELFEQLIYNGKIKISYEEDTYVKTCQRLKVLLF